MSESTLTMEGEQPGGACKRVLIAEDDAMFRKILRSWLERWGFDVTVAEDGAKAWAILQEEPAPQLVILDWMMPQPNGVELCRLLRARDATPYQYILLLTAKDDQQDIIQGLEAGADDYLTKPFDKNELRARLRTGKRILTLQDEQIKNREQLQYQATHDALTSIWNRRAILEVLHREFERAKRFKSVFGMLILDLDHFKTVNDSFGHLAGDEVLCEAARRIQKTIRSYDMAGRYGGEEFLVVLPGCDREELQLCAERIRLAISSAPIFAEGAEIGLTVSGGSALVNPHSSTERDVLAGADSALYQAKDQGRNRVIPWDSLNPEGYMAL